MQYQARLSKFIRELRESKKITLNSFAIKNGIEPSTLSRIEKGLLELKVSNLEKIAEGFGLSPADFLKKFENKYNSEV